MINNIFKRHDLAQLKAGMEITWREQLQSNHNMVNAETPGFQVRHTDFRSLMLSGEEPRGEGFELYLEALEGPQPFDLERELRRLSQANLSNSAYSKMLIKRYSDLRTAIREGH